jgi:flagellar hook-associated protein FlgK
MGSVDALLTHLAAYGAPGLVISALLLWLKRLQDHLDADHKARVQDVENHAKELRELQEKRLQDAKEATSRALELQEAVHRSVDKLSELVDIVSGPLPQKRQSRHDGD